MKGDEDKVREVCRKYRSARQAIQIAVKGVATIQKKIESAETDHERKLYESALERKQEEVRILNDIIKTFSTCIDVLPADERSVVEQIYVKGKKWRDVTDLQGNTLPLSQSINIWKRARRKMAAYV